MGKRSRDKDYSEISKKIKKLEELLNRNKRRRISSSSESESEHSTSDLEILNEIPPCDSPSLQIENDIPNMNDDELDPEILDILGSDPNSEQAFGDKIHKDVASRWNFIIRNGLQKDAKGELLKSYLPPENCNTSAPKLNLEIKAALSEINFKKDFFHQGKQKQISSALSALGKALDLALAKNDQELLKPLNDVGKIVCDLQYRESQSRRYAIINTLKKDMKDTLRDTKIDENLFGSDLAAQLNASKAITKSGSELRPTTSSTRASASTANKFRRGTLNARGVSRQPVSEPRQLNPTYQRRQVQRGRRYQESTRTSASYQQRGRRS